MSEADPGLVIAFAAIVGGLAAYFAGFAFVQALRRRPPDEHRTPDAGNESSSPSPRRRANARPQLIESTPY